jgi:tetratricopeptide (TPR) repeat protein/uncharacterized caspase-like protein
MRTLRHANLVLLAGLLFGLSAAVCGQRRELSVVQRGAALDGKGNLWAVVVGVSNYKNLPADKQLQFAHRDAQAFAAFLRSPQGGGFPSTHIRVLVNQDATLSALRTALGTWLARSAEKDDVVYIFFAGHGVVEGERDGYLVAHDSDPQNLYATALSVAELDRLVGERLRARTVVLIADACHSGNIGWTSRATAEQVLIGRYLDEVGKAGRGVFRLLGSRADENSYEDRRWGGGHGVFTYHLLEGLKGKADQDKDGFVRATEALDYLARVVPTETKSLQHPRSAGNVDPRLPLSVIPPAPPAPVVKPPSNAPAGAPGRPGLPSAPTTAAALEVRGAPGCEVYVNNTYRGRIRQSGVLVVEGLSLGRQEISIDPPGGESFTQTVALATPRTVLDVARPAAAAVKSSSLVGQIRQALSQRLVVEPDGAWPLYERLVRETPHEAERANIEIELSAALEEIGQQAINDYVRLPLTQIKPDAFSRAAAAFGHLQKFRPGDTQLEERRLFCEGRALLLQGRTADALVRLERAFRLNPRAAYTLNAIGLAYEDARVYDKSLDAFRRAAELAPHWSLPRTHIGNVYLMQGKLDKSEDELRRAVELDPLNPDPRLLLGNVYLYRNKPDRAEAELRRALELSPHSPDARYLLGVAYRRQGRLAEAERELAALVRGRPNHAGAHQELGLIYEAGQQYAKAADALEAYLRLEPNAPYRDEIRRRAARNREMAGRQTPTLRRG